MIKNYKKIKISINEKALSSQVKTTLWKLLPKIIKLKEVLK